MGNLSEKNQARLDKWQEKMKGNIEGTKPVSSGWDYGDNISDYQRKEQELWNREVELNQQYARRR